MNSFKEPECFEKKIFSFFSFFLVRTVMNDVHTWLRYIANGIRIISDMHEYVSTGACIAQSDVQLFHRRTGRQPYPRGS